MKKLVNIFTKIMIWAALLLLVITLAGTIFTIDYHATLFCRGESHYGTPLAIGLILLGTIGLIFLWRTLARKMDAMQARTRRRMCIGMLALFAVICAAICCFVPAEPQKDSAVIQKMALYMANHHTLHIDTSKEYFQKYSNNDLLTILLSVYFRIMLFFGVTKDNIACMWLNAVCIFGGEILSYFGVKTFFGEKRAAKYLMISVMQPTIYLSVVWAYSNTLCLPFMCGLFFLAAKLYRSKHNWKRCVLAAFAVLVTVVGYYLRPVVAIEAIALGICAILDCCAGRRNIRHLPILLCVAAVVTLLSGYGMHTFVTTYGGDNSANFPMSHWVMMGLHGDGKYEDSDSDYTESFTGKAAKQAADCAEIKATLQKLGPIGLVRHGVQKQITTWSIGSANYLLRMKHVDSNTALVRLLKGRLRSFLMLYCQIFRAAIVLLAILTLLGRREYDSKCFLAVLTLFGGMLFYLLWEAKESYSIPFLFLLVILAAVGQTLRAAPPKKPELVETDGGGKPLAST